MKAPLITVITPTYNHEKFIGECIRSVQRQTFPDWEMIVVNDGSKDQTASIVREFMREDQRIKLLDRENIGIFRLNETYNVALDEARGKYIAVLEGDDWWEQEKLQRQVEAMEANDETVLAWHPAKPSNNNTSMKTLPKELTENEQKAYSNTPVGEILNVLFLVNVIPAVSLFIRKSALEKIDGFKQGYDLPLVDLPTLLELAAQGPFHYSTEHLATWREYTGQITKTYPEVIMEGIYRLVMDKFREFRQDSHLQIRLTGKEVKKAYQRKLVQAYSRSGRYKLIRKDFSGARKAYRASIFRFGMNEPVWKIRSLIGFIFSLFHMNVEGLARLIGNSYYPTEK